MSFSLESGIAPLLSLRDSILKLGELVRDPSSDLPEEELPRLDSLIQDWQEEKVKDEEEFFSRILLVFKESTHNEVYHQVLQKYSESRRQAINDFADGVKSAEEIAHCFMPGFDQDEDATEKHAVGHPLARARRPFSSLLGTTESPEVYNKPDFKFKNWGQNIQFTPALTYYPESIEDVKAIVKDSVKNGRGIRVSGYRHSWAPVFGRENQSDKPNTGDVMISMLSEHTAGVLPNLTSLPTSLVEPEVNQLNNIIPVDHTYVNGKVLADGKQYIRVGAATTNEQFRRWCLKTGRVTLPMNIIEVEITMGGANAPICHGAGIRHATLSDLVRAIEYVDVNGEQQRVDMSDARLLKAAAGCFGLLGVVTHITYECDPIATAVMRPKKLDVVRAIPPPPGMKDSEIPESLRIHLTDLEKEEDQRDFERRANSDFYAEWFWFPFSSKVWVNSWSTDKDTSKVVDYPSNVKTTVQVLATIAGNVGQILIQKIHALEVFPHLQTTFMSWLAMRNLDEVIDDTKPIRALIPDALHFQRGVTNIRVRDLEVEFPLQARPGTKRRDYTSVQKAWWQAILACYDNIGNCPQRMPLEMRIMGGSEITMAPQRGHNLGTCSIEILTLHAAKDIWEPYAQEVLNKWTSLEGVDGKPLMVRPHWAKEWDKFTVKDRPWREVLKHESYAKEIVEFRNLLAEIGKKQGWTLGDLKRTFSNELLDYMFLDTVQATAYPGVSPLPAAAAKTDHYWGWVNPEFATMRNLVKSLRTGIKHRRAALAAHLTFH